MAAVEQFYEGGYLGAALPPQTLLSRARPLSLPYEPLQVLASLEDVRAAARRVAGCAQRLLSIYTVNLEPEVYDEAAFLE
jgi:hypothetical protein